MNGNAAPGQIGLSGISLTTLAYVVAKCHVPALKNVGPVLIEASEITPFLGDPSGDSYYSTQYKMGERAPVPYPPQEADRAEEARKLECGAESGSIPYMTSLLLDHRHLVIGEANATRRRAEYVDLEVAKQFRCSDWCQRTVTHHRVFTRVHEHADQGLLVNCNSMDYLPIAPASDCPAPN